MNIHLLSTNKMPSLHRVRQNQNTSTRKRPRDSVTPSSVPGTRLTLRQRVDILTLRNDAGWGYTRISTSLNIPRSTVRRTIQHPEMPEKPRGRVPNLNNPKRQGLIRRATADVPITDIAAIEGMDACRRMLRAAFEKGEIH